MRLGNLGVTLPTANFLAVHMVRGVASASKDFQCWAFAALIDLKYPCLESLATALSCGSFVAQASRADVWKSFRSVVSSGNRYGLALIEGRRRGVWAVSSTTRVFRFESNHFSSEYLVGRFGRRGSMTSLSSGSRVGQSFLIQFGAGGGGALMG